MMRTIMIQQPSFIIDDYVYSIWHQRPEFAHSATWHTESRHENPLCSGNIRDSGLGSIPAPQLPISWPSGNMFSLTRIISQAPRQAQCLL